MNFTQRDTDSRKYANQLQIRVPLELPGELEVVCRSASSKDTSFEIFDHLKESMGVRVFSCGRGPILSEFNRCLVVDLNILLEGSNVQIDTKDFLPISNLVVQKCESRYGDGVDEGDCLITIC